MWKSAQIVNVWLHSLLQHPDQDIEHCNSEAPSHPMPRLSLPFSPKVTVIQNYKVTISFSCFIMLSYDIYSFVVGFYSIYIVLEIHAYCYIDHSF